MKFHFINIVDKNRQKLLKICKEFEENYDLNILTGISFIHTRDNKDLLAFVFSNKIEYDKALEIVNKEGFERVLTEELQYAELLEMSEDIAFIGNFTYKMMSD